MITMTSAPQTHRPGSLIGYIPIATFTSPPSLFTTPSSSTNDMQSSTVTFHTGPAASIPSTASPGLLFLKSFLAAIDSLDPTPHPLDHLVADHATLILGNNPPSHSSRIRPMLEVRSKHLEKFGHELHLAWDIELPGQRSGDTDTDTDTSEGKGKGRRRRTVMFEATSATVFKNDPDHFEIKVKEFNILELEDAVDGDARLVAAEIRTYLDGRPVQDRAARLHSQSSYAESRSQY